MTIPLRVLILEDRPSEAELMLQELRRAKFDPQWQRVDTEADYLANLDPAPDVILADYSLPQFDAMQALRLMQERGLDVPFIVVTGRVSEEVAVECMKQGAADYLLKDRLARLGPAVRHAIDEKVTRDEKKRAEKALLLSDQRYRGIFEGVQDAIFIESLTGEILDVNARACEMFGWTREEFLTKTVSDLVPEEHIAVIPSVIYAGGLPDTPVETVNIRANGERFSVELSARLQNLDGETVMLVVLRDLTEVRQAQRQAELQDRLAAVGQLAAGIAHDFNNILGTIILYSQLLLDGQQHLPQDRERLTTIFSQAQRGAALISQILDFSRRSVMEPHVMDLLPFLKEVEKLLTRTLPENIRVRLHFDREAFVLMADPTRMQQVIMNLALNARDAMPDGGELSIELTQLEVKDQQVAAHPEMEPGRWVRIRITDTGTGIPPDVLQHIFEPFFTTRPTGKGTGLGLAQVYGIVKQHDGYIDVESQQGRGTTFTVYIPASDEMVPPEITPDIGTVEAGGGETILLVEDDEATRAAISDTLGSLDYRVLHASNGREALRVYQRKADEIDLVLSDLVMPDMGGRALFHALSEMSQEVNVVLMSGYPLSSETDELLDRPRVAWLQKPFSTMTIARAVRQALVPKDLTGGARSLHQ